MIITITRILLGTVYPAYSSYKALTTKNVREYVKWMMYWIVFAIFTSFESIADVFIGFWLPFYYELKLLCLIWLVCPVTRDSLGSSVLYRQFVHPTLKSKEKEIDRMIGKFQEQSYNAVTKMAVNALTFLSGIVLQTVTRAPTLMNEIIEAQRLQQNALQGSSNAGDVTDAPSTTEPRFVEIMDVDNGPDQEELDRAVEMELSPPKAEPNEEPTTKTRQCRSRKMEKTSYELSSGSENEEIKNDADSDSDFKPPTRVATRKSKRTRSKSKKST